MSFSEFVNEKDIVPENEFSRFIGSEQILQFPKKIMKKLHLEKKHTEENQISRCYTCKPRGSVKKHIIGNSFCGNFIFHHDMSHRPLILLTPVFHVKTIYELNETQLSLMFNSIKVFCSFWSIDDYQVSFNNGAWQTHHHFHIKIKIDDKIANRMRGDHFRKIKLEEQYV